MEIHNAELTASQNKHQFLEKVRLSDEAVQAGQFNVAIRLYTEALALDPLNHILYSNRSAAYVKVAKYQRALQDALKCQELNPQWPKAHYRQGIALQCLGQHADALAAFATGLAQDPKSSQSLGGMVDAALKSPLKERFGPIYDQLQKMKLDKSPFVIISVIGQEMLPYGFFAASVVILEAALRIGTCSLKLKGSVFSALSSAHWGLGSIDKAIAYMHQDLGVAKSLGDQLGECRAHGNLGAAHFSKGNYKEALTHHRFQLILAMKQLKDHQTAASALSSLGHVYTAVGDYPNALACHKQCVLLVKRSNNKLTEAREIGNVGAVYLAMGDFDNAVECHNEHLKLAKQLKDKSEEARAYSNLGSAHHYKRNFDKAIAFHNQVLSIAEDLREKTLEARAYAGLGHAARCMNDFTRAKHYHEKQLDNALHTKDKVAEGRACSNLGIIYQNLNEYDAAIKLHKAHLKTAKDLQDQASMGRAYGNIGNGYSALGQYDLAVKYHKQELAISKEVNDRHSEASTHGNLAVAYQALNMHEKAVHHYNAHLTIAQELKDTSSEARALSNLGNYHSARGEFVQAIPFYEQYLILSQELHNMEAEGKACHKLGYAHYSLGNSREAIRYYEQDLALAKDLQDKGSQGRAYCNLGLAYKAMGYYPEALDAQKKFLNLTVAMKNVSGIFRALGNMGDIYIKMGDTNEAINMYKKQLDLARQAKDRHLEATACGALGAAHRMTGQHDIALGKHNEELTIRQEISDIRGECKALGNLGNVHVALGNYSHAFKNYEEQLARARDLQDSTLESQACGNLGITKMNMGHFEDAIGYFEQQLAMLAQAISPNVLYDEGRAFGNLGDCYEALGDYEESVKCHDQFLTISQKVSNIPGQERAYRGLGNAHRALGNLQQALVCFEKRLVVAHELDDDVAKASAYGELGCLHSLLGNYEQAISCLEHQMNISRGIEDKIMEGDATCGLGGVYHQMGEFESALKYHQLDLQIAEQSKNRACQCRAYGNLGLSYESLGDFKNAIMYQEQHLSIAAQMNDRVAKTLAYSSLGRVHHAIGNYQQAVQYLQQGLQIAEQLGRKEDEAKIRHRLGLALWAHGELNESQHQLYKATELFEMIRREAQSGTDYKLSLFDLQTASYQALQRVLVALGRHEEALVVAERGRTRAFVDLLMERQSGDGTPVTDIDNSPITVDRIVSIVTRQKSAILYYSLAAGYLYSWFITPDKGITKFHECNLSELEVAGSDNSDTHSIGTTSLLDQYVGHIRESLGVDQNITRLPIGRPSTVSESDSESDEMWQQHMEEIGGRLNAENDRTGFLRMVNRNHPFNSSSYSLSSIVSFSSNISGMTNGSKGSNVRRVRTNNSGRAPIGALYKLLISPMEDVLTAYKNTSSGFRELVLVLQGDLYLVPFAVLRGSQASQCLYERFDLIAAPSIHSIQTSQASVKPSKIYPSSTGALVVGNGRLPANIVEQYQWKPLPGAELEAKLVAEMQGTKALTGAHATKEAVMRQMPNTEVIHFATHITWKLSAIVLSPIDPKSMKHEPLQSGRSGQLESLDINDSSNFDGPALSDFLLTAADILNIKLHSKLVVLSSGHTVDRAGRINADGVIGLTRALLAAGTQCVLFSLWPVPEQASRVFMKAFYTTMLQGCKTSRALSDGMKAVQLTNQYSHPSNWAGWMALGSDVKLNSKVALMGHALFELVQSPSTKCREAMRVLLHLIEKSLQRIQRGQRNAMYTTQQSIENKVGNIPGWKDLLMSVGFRFEPSANNLPPAVFFPQTDPGDRLSQCSASLQALLGLSQTTIAAISKLLPHHEAGEPIITLLRDINARFLKDANLEVTVGVKLWRVQGCHEFLASLGFDLVGVGHNEVTLRLGKQANRRLLQFALTALVALFDTQDAPRILLESASSMESLASSHSGSATSTSNFSNGSSGTPLSPNSDKKRSIFNPAEVEKMKSARSRAENTLQSRKSQKPKSSIRNVSLHLDHLSEIKKKYGSDSSSPCYDSQEGYSDSQDEQRPQVLAIELHEDGDDETSSLSSHTQQDDVTATSRQRTPNRTYYQNQQNSNNYSTSSQSEGEDIPDSRSPVLHRQSYFRSSNASGSSTLTLKSTSSTLTAKSVNSAMRRSHGRSSTVSNKSNDRLNRAVSRESLQSRTSSTLGKSPNRSTESLDLSTNDSSTADGVLITDEVDPTEIANRVLQETVQERFALEHMQRLSIQKQAISAHKIRSGIDSDVVDKESNVNPEKHVSPVPRTSISSTDATPTGPIIMYDLNERDSEYLTSENEAAPPAMKTVTFSSPVHQTSTFVHSPYDSSCDAEIQKHLHEGSDSSSSSRAPQTLPKPNLSISITANRKICYKKHGSENENSDQDKEKPDAKTEKPVYAQSSKNVSLNASISSIFPVAKPKSQVRPPIKGSIGLRPNESRPSAFKSLKPKLSDSDGNSSPKDQQTKRVLPEGGSDGTDTRTDTSTDGSNKRDSLNSSFQLPSNYDSASSLSDDPTTSRRSSSKQNKLVSAAYLNRYVSRAPGFNVNRQSDSKSAVQRLQNGPLTKTLAAAEQFDEEMSPTVTNHPPPGGVRVLYGDGHHNIPNDDKKILYASKC
ncbi:tetratricopeptide repeat protein 28-like isoform X2 [Tubulanus polymorphus]